MTSSTKTTENTPLRSISSDFIGGGSGTDYSGWVIGLHPTSLLGEGEVKSLWSCFVFEGDEVGQRHLAEVTVLVGLVRRGTMFLEKVGGCKTKRVRIRPPPSEV